MRQPRVLKACAIAALSLAGLSASAAHASFLVLKTANGGPIQPGTATGLSGFVFPESPPSVTNCSPFTLTGSLVGNESPKDRLDFSTMGESTCEEGGGHTMVVHVSLGEVGLSKSGRYKMAPRTMTIERFGPCVYETKTIKRDFQIGGTLSLGAGVTTVGGKLNSTLSNVTCPKRQPFGLEWGSLIDEATGELYESELRKAES
jgi:hypothetical protein